MPKITAIPWRGFSCAVLKFSAKPYLQVSICEGVQLESIHAVPDLVLFKDFPQPSRSGRSRLRNLDSLADRDLPDDQPAKHAGYK